MYSHSVITFTAVVDEALEAFNQTAFRHNLAASLDDVVNPSQIDLNVSAASVRVLSTITVTKSEQVAGTVMKSLEALSVSTSAMSVALGVHVQSATAPAIQTVMEPRYPANGSSSSPPSFDTPGAASLTKSSAADSLVISLGGAGLGLALFACVAACVYWYRRGRKHGDGARRSQHRGSAGRSPPSCTTVLSSTVSTIHHINTVSTSSRQQGGGGGWDGGATAVTAPPPGKGGEFVEVQLHDLPVPTSSSSSSSPASSTAHGKRRVFSFAKTAAGCRTSSHSLRTLGVEAASSTAAAAVSTSTTSSLSSPSAARMHRAGDVHVGPGGDGGSACHHASREAMLHRIDGDALLVEEDQVRYM